MSRVKAPFVGADLGGNVLRTLAVARARGARGVDVELAGFGPSTADPTLSVVPLEWGAGPRQAFLDRFLSRRAAAAAAALIGQREADVVVADCMTLALLRGAIDSGVPTIVLFHTFGAYWVGPFRRLPMGLVTRRRGDPVELWARATRRLLLTDRSLDPGEGDPAFIDAEWTGTTERGRDPVPREPGTRPRVLVSFSSGALPGQAAAYRRVIAALRGLSLDVVVTTGGAVTGLRPMPGVEIHDWADHAALMPGIDLVVGHGGHSTTMKALAHGIPLLILPMNPTADQRLVGETVAAAGLGSWLPRTASVARIRVTAAGLLADEGVRSRAAETGLRLRAASPGAEVAASAILSAV